jgi:hypothetical protein
MAYSNSHVEPKSYSEPNSENTSRKEKLLPASFNTKPQGIREYSNFKGKR